VAEWLPTTAYALLGVMSFGEEFTGYQLERRATVSLRHFFWSPAMSQIYTELRRLEQRGLVSHRENAADEPRARRVYKITERGAAELARWVGEGPDDSPSVLKSLTLLRTFAGHVVPPDVLRAKVEAHRAWAERGLAELRQTREAVVGRSLEDPRWRYAVEVVEWGLDYYAAEAAAAARLAERLGALAVAEEQVQRADDAAE
jgi:DNA-binding PadR family transcriptional regulator